MERFSFPKTKKELLRFLKNNALVVLGTLVLSFGLGIFLIPFELVTGGLPGVGIVLAHILRNFEPLSELGAEFYTSILVWIFFLLGYIILGRSFAAKTLVSSLIYPFTLSLATKIAESNFLDGFFNLASERYAAYGGFSVLLAAVFGGALVGTGCSLTFLGGGSTGGVDIIALTIAKYFPKIKSSHAMFLTDGIIIILGILVLQNLVLTLLGIVSAFVCALTIDKLFVGENDAFIAHVVSLHNEEIKDAVIHRLHRTTTVLPCRGGYSGREMQMLMVTFSIKQYADFMALISSIDKSAFITLHRAREIRGEGWTYRLPPHEPAKTEQGQPLAAEDPMGQAAVDVATEAKSESSPPPPVEIPPVPDSSNP